MSLDVARADLCVGVVGAGAMGRGIAQVSAQGGIRTLVYDAAPGGAAKAKAAIGEQLRSLVAKGRLEQNACDAAEANLQVAEDLMALAPCHVVIEAVFEDLEVKRKLFLEIEAVVAETTIIASNTSSIRIASIARALKRRDRVCGMHYFNPVPLMKLVEVIRAADTAPWAVDAMVALGKRQTRVPVVVGDTPGFLVNLGGTAIGTEGLRIYTEGRATPSQIDAVMRDAGGFRMGPFELMDLTGIDVNFPARKIIYEGFFHDRRMTPSPYHEGLFHAGRLGRKTGGGWYAYDEKGGKIDPGADLAPAGAAAATVVAGPSADSAVLDLLKAGGAKLLEADDGKSPIVVTPLGDDCTTVCVEKRLDPKRVVAIDPTGAVAKRATMMTAPGGDTAARDAVALVLIKAGAKVTAIKDSPGFVLQRMRAMIANLGCEMAQIGIASPADVDTAMTLGLNYPQGPLAMADLMGVAATHGILQRIQAITGDDRYRPSQWLRRRAQLGLVAATPE
ncbi:MAG: 3-hydroxyacyl-CoA dehydrogenase [Rhodospirillales bacterium]|nr:MAG: 3-hydroxyacyl-CoA dehydrogenase [Rhodospirillales bacterium]